MESLQTLLEQQLVAQQAPETVKEEAEPPFPSSSSSAAAADAAAVLRSNKLAGGSKSTARKEGKSASNTSASKPAANKKVAEVPPSQSITSFFSTKPRAPSPSPSFEMEEEEKEPKAAQDAEAPALPPSSASSEAAPAPTKIQQSLVIDLVGSGDSNGEESRGGEANENDDDERPASPAPSPLGTKRTSSSPSLTPETSSSKAKGSGSKRAKVEFTDAQAEDLVAAIRAESRRSLDDLITAFQETHPGLTKVLLKSEIAKVAVRVKRQWHVLADGPPPSAEKHAKAAAAAAAGATDKAATATEPEGTTKKQVSPASSKPVEEAPEDSANASVFQGWLEEFRADSLALSNAAQAMPTVPVEPLLELASACKAAPQDAALLSRLVSCVAQGKKDANGAGIVQSVLGLVGSGETAPGCDVVNRVLRERAELVNFGTKSVPVAFWVCMKGSNYVDDIELAWPGGKVLIEIGVGTLQRLSTRIREDERWLRKAQSAATEDDRNAITEALNARIAKDAKAKLKAQQSVEQSRAKAEAEEKKRLEKEAAALAKQQEKQSRKEEMRAQKEAAAAAKAMEEEQKKNKYQSFFGKFLKKPTESECAGPERKTCEVASGGNDAPAAGGVAANAGATEGATTNVDVAVDDDVVLVASPAKSTAFVPPKPSDNDLTTLPVIGPSDALAAFRESLKRRRSACKPRSKKRIYLKFGEMRKPQFFGPPPGEIIGAPRSTTIKPRRPLERDGKVEYDVDSDWDTEEERGESIDGHDSDDNDLAEEKDLDYGDGWLLPDDVVIEQGEGNETVTVKRTVLGGAARAKAAVQTWAGVSFDGVKSSPVPEVDPAMRIPLPPSDPNVLLKYRVICFDVQDDEPAVVTSTTPTGEKGQSKRLVPDRMVKPMVELVEGSDLSKDELVKALDEALAKLCVDKEKPPSKAQIVKKLEEIAAKEAKGGEKKRRWYVKDEVLNTVGVARFVQTTQA